MIRMIVETMRMKNMHDWVLWSGPSSLLRWFKVFLQNWIAWQSKWLSGRKRWNKMYDTQFLGLSIVHVFMFWVKKMYFKIFSLCREQRLRIQWRWKELPPWVQSFAVSLWRWNLYWQGQFVWWKSWLWLQRRRKGLYNKFRIPFGRNV